MEISAVILPEYIIPKGSCRICQQQITINYLKYVGEKSVEVIKAITEFFNR